MNQPIIEFEREVTLRKVMKIPDRRFKSGYRGKSVLAQTIAILPNGMDGTNVSLTHIHKHGNTLTRTDAFGHVEFTLETREGKL